MIIKSRITNLAATSGSPLMLGAKKAMWELPCKLGMNFNRWMSAHQPCLRGSPAKTHCQLYACAWVSCAITLVDDVERFGKGASLWMTFTNSGATNKHQEARKDWGHDFDQFWGSCLVVSLEQLKGLPPKKWFRNTSELKGPPRQKKKVR